MCCLSLTSSSPVDAEETLQSHEGGRLANAIVCFSPYARASLPLENSAKNLRALGSLSCLRLRLQSLAAVQGEPPASPTRAEPNEQSRGAK